MQLGGKGSVTGDLHAKVEKDVMLLGKLRTHLTCRFRAPNKRLIDTVSVSGALGDVVYEATRSMNGDGKGTEVSVGYSLPAGLQLFADARMLPTGEHTIDSLSAFHVAGPFNVQPSWILPTRTLRLKMCRGGRWHSCPFDVQTDLHADGAPADYEIGYDQELHSGRTLKARLLMPAQAAARQMWAEYRDATIEEGGTWICRAAMPLGDDVDARGGLIHRAEFSLRRAWQW